jgi:threonine dehydratase
VFVAIGGGGLISGWQSYVKRLRPHTKVIGVETVDADAMARSLKAGHRVRLDQVGLFADGVAVKQVGEETFRLCQTLVDDMILVDTDATCAAIKDVFEDTRSILEPAGALAIAGCQGLATSPANRIRTKSGRRGLRREHEFRPLAFCCRAAEVGEQREAIARGHHSRETGQLQALLHTDRQAQRSPSSITAIAE